MEMFCILIGVVVAQVYICVKTHRNVHTHTHIHFTLCKQNKKRIHILRMCAQMFKMLRMHHQKSLDLRRLFLQLEKLRPESENNLIKSKRSMKQRQEWIFFLEMYLVPVSHPRPNQPGLIWPPFSFRQFLNSEFSVRDRIESLLQI